jgi:uncharacterized protein with HEPN domain
LSLRSRDPRVVFEDILENVGRIERHTAGMDKASFEKDEKTIDAVERCLARISEAAVKLGDRAQELCPGVAWRDVRGLGNHLRHEYRRVDLSRIWAMVEEHLPALKSACAGALERLKGSDQGSE